MSKVSGLAQNLYVGGYNLSGDVGSVDNASGPQDALDVTGIDKSAHERIGGRRDGVLEWTSFFNAAASRAHPVLSVLPTTDVIASWFLGTTLGDPAASIVGKQINYDPSRADDGALTVGISVNGNAYGLEWGRQLTAGIATYGGASTGSSLDYGAAIGTTNFGLQAYLHTFAFTGTSATVAIQSSTDNGGGDAFAAITGATFTAVTAIGSERIQTGATAAVERYLRISVTGTFSLFWFAVSVVRNETAVVF